MFYTNLKVSSRSVKSTSGISIGNGFTLYMALDSMVTLSESVLPIQEHGVFSHLSVFSLFN